MDLYIKTMNGFQRIPPEMQSADATNLFPVVRSVSQNDYLLTSASWQIPGPADPRPVQGYWEGVKERAAHEMDGMTSEISLWVLQSIGDVLKELGLWMVKVAPDTGITLAMMCCLGAIGSIPKMGKWAAVATVFSILAEMVRKSTFGV